MRIAFNGWPLSPAAQTQSAGDGLDLGAHLLLAFLAALIERRPDWEFALVHPPGELPALPAGIACHPVASGVTAWDRMRFEQLRLPAALRRVGAQVLWTPDLVAPLLCPAAVVAPCDLGDPDPGGGSIAARLQRALARTGADQAALRFLPSDLRGDIPDRQAVALPPFVGRLFVPGPLQRDHAALRSLRIDRPFVLSHNPAPSQVASLLAAWRWVVAALGDSHLLLLLGLEDPNRRQALAAAARLGLSETVRSAGRVHFAELPALYRTAAAFLGDGRRWRHEIRHALAVGLPVAAAASEAVAAVVGPAAYLVPAGDPRLLGAACLAILVQEDLARSLRDKALLRASAFQAGEWLPPWEAVLERAAARPDRHRRPPPGMAGGRPL